MAELIGVVIEAFLESLGDIIVGAWFWVTHWRKK